MQTKYSLSILFCFSSLLYGCATIMHGTSQQIGISSNPTGAKVTVDNMSTGTTSTFANLSRGSNHVVKIEMPGYMPSEMTITGKASGWVWGNILFGGLIGLAIDAASGGLYDLTPEQLHAELKVNDSENLYRQKSNMPKENSLQKITLYLNNGKMLSGTISDVNDNIIMLENETHWYKINKTDIKAAKIDGKTISIEDVINPH